jgi:DNA invertase Pin-like site-specific DNA recombinase
MARAERRRCATYTRKSSEEGLDQDLNSLDAQREACEAYIRSQAGEGWTPARTRYDDGGYSGGRLERPGLERLLADIEAGKIDTVVVYKVDRLTRSLADFAKIVEVFDASGVSFVSVTQQFNTTTSMGRLTLNMLLSFAQFEREVTGERIRDKIAASKRKGMWMGGPVPLGYEPEGRTLIINEAEAETVRTLYRLYLERGSIQQVKAEADRLELTSKVRHGASKRTWGGQPFGRGYLHRLLSNPLYAGRIPHNGDHYEGQHPAIIDPETWEVVQERLTVQAPPPTSRAREGRPSPLRGRLFDEAGVVLTPSHTVKSGRRYRYYVSRQGSAGTSRSTRQRWRLPAREIERWVGEATLALLSNPAELASGAGEAAIGKRRISDLIERARDWTGDPLRLVQRIELGVDTSTIHIDLSDLLDGHEAIVRQTIATRIRRRGVETRLVLEDGSCDSRTPRIDPALVKVIVRGRKWFEDLANGRVQSLVEIADAEGVSDRYVGNLMPLAFLAPEIVASILSGTQPPDLTANALVKRTRLPLGWDEQRSVLGFDRA